MNLLTSLLRRDKIAEFISTNEGVKAFENLQRDITNIWPAVSSLAADFSNSTVTLIDSGMLGGLQANSTYLIEAFLTYQSAAVTTGITVGLTIPSGVISGGFNTNTSATAIEGSYSIAGGTVKGTTSGVLVANENVFLRGAWLVNTSATAGNANLQFASEVGGSAVKLIGGLSLCKFTQLI